MLTNERPATAPWAGAARGARRSIDAEDGAAAVAVAARVVASSPATTRASTLARFGRLSLRGRAVESARCSWMMQNMVAETTAAAGSSARRRRQPQPTQRLAMCERMAPRQVKRGPPRRLLSPSRRARSSHCSSDLPAMSPAITARRWCGHELGHSGRCRHGQRLDMAEKARDACPGCVPGYVAYKIVGQAV